MIHDENDILLFPEEKIFTNIWVKDIDIPLGSTYYVTERKNFKLKDRPEHEQELSFESLVHTVTNDDDTISNMLLKEYVTIDKPTLLLKLKDIENSENTITINSSSYRGKGDGHTHTHWVIKVDGKVKFKSLEDKDNKTSITIDKYILDFENSLEIYVIHCSNNIESETLKYTLQKSNVNFKVVSNLINVPIEDYTLSISKIDIEKIMKLSKVYVLHNDMVIKSYEISSDNNTVNLVLPKKYIEPNTTLILDLYGYNALDELTKLQYKLIPQNLKYEVNTNKDYIYNKEFKGKVFNNIIPKGLVTDNIGNNIIMPVMDGFRLRKYDSELGLINVSTLNGLSHLGNIEDMYIRVNSDNTILIDCINSNGKPTFLVYGYSNINNINSYFLLNTLVRDDEVKTVAFNNSIEQISNDTFIYNVVGTNILKQYNKKTNKTKVLKNINVPDTTSITILKMDDNQLLCIPNKGLRTKVYLIDKNKYIEGMLLEFSNYSSNNIKKIDLINGDRILIKNTSDTNRDNLLYFDISEYKLSELDFNIENTDNNVILKKNNGVFIGNVLEKDYINYNQDRLELISFT